jgi:hypothetical protein
LLRVIDHEAVLMDPKLFSSWVQRLVSDPAAEAGMALFTTTLRRQVFTLYDGGVLWSASAERGAWSGVSASASSRDSLYMKYEMMPSKEVATCHVRCF